MYVQASLLDLKHAVHPPADTRSMSTCCQASGPLKRPGPPIPRTVLASNGIGLASRFLSLVHAGPKVTLTLTGTLGWKTA